jgi:hypothetical protein
MVASFFLFHQNDEGGGSVPNFIGAKSRHSTGRLMAAT